jgi:hypothetical protein
MDTPLPVAGYSELFKAAWKAAHLLVRVRDPAIVAGCMDPQPQMPESLSHVHKQSLLTYSCFVNVGPQRSCSTLRILSVSSKA